VLVGRKSSDRQLEDGVLYLRYGVPAMNLVSLREFLVEGVPPFVYMARGGLYVNIDGDVLEEHRRAEELSLGQVANELGVSRRSVSKYESGMDATLDVAMELEDLFEEPLIAPVDPFDRIDDPEEGPEEREPDDREEPFSDLVTAGFEVMLTQRAPFRAVSEEHEAEEPDTVLTGTSRSGGDLEKRARLMSSIAEVVGTRSVYLVDDQPRRQTIEETVLLGLDELRDVDGADDFDEVYRDKLT
jgi:putative transcriptional regulator